MGSMSQIKRNDFDIWSIEAGAFGLNMDLNFGGRKKDQKQASIVAIGGRDALSTSMCLALRAASLFRPNKKPAFREKRGFSIWWS